MVHHGSFKSAFSSDDDRFDDGDDSVLEGGANKVGVVSKHSDNFAYVDAMQTRMNDTDMRLLTNTITEKAPKDDDDGDIKNFSKEKKALN